MPRTSLSYRQAVKLKDLASLSADSLKERMMKDGKMIVTPDDAKSLYAVIKAFDTACDRIRILRNRPLPGSFKPQSKKPKTKNNITALPVQPTVLGGGEVEKVS